LEDPGALLEQSAKSLPDDGRLLLALPNGGECEVVGEGWIGFRVDLEHLNYFSVRTLSRLLAKHDLFLEQFWLDSQPGVLRCSLANAESRRILNRIRRIPHRAKRIVQRLLTPSSVGQACDNGSFGLTVLARKVPSRSR
jgi:hypothetical protein